MKFNPHFNIKKIIQTLEKAASPASGQPSAQAASTLGELYYMQAKHTPEMINTSLKCYEMAAKQGCAYAEYWVGYINVLSTKKLDVAYKSFVNSYKKANINAGYQLFLLYSKAPEFLNVVKAYKCLRKCCEFAVPCQDELHEYFKGHMAELKSLDDSWKAWPDAELINIHKGEIGKLTTRMNDATQTDALYKRPSVVFLENKGNWFLSMQVKNFVSNVLGYPLADFVITLKEELLPVFSSLGLYMLENWLARAQSSKKKNKAKIQALQDAIELVTLYLAEGLEGLMEKLKRRQKKFTVAPKADRKKYLYTDYIHPSYFKEQEEATEGIVCGYCNKPQGEGKFDMCSACKKVYYCSKECQLKDWKAGHKAVCTKHAAK
ncbi:MAG: zinc finger MYND domain-containing protein [Acidobacteriaceae bacterium]|nr:zinc finger MYND domain-containing protein [Acidobacteriaceae bacterium]